MGRFTFGVILGLVIGIISHVFAGRRASVTQVGERIWLVTFMQHDLGYFDDETCRLEPIENPFGPKLLPIRSE